MSEDLARAHWREVYAKAARNAAIRGHERMKMKKGEIAR